MDHRFRNFVLSHLVPPSKVACDRVMKPEKALSSAACVKFGRRYPMPTYIMQSIYLATRYYQGDLPVPGAL